MAEQTKVIIFTEKPALLAELVQAAAFDQGSDVEITALLIGAEESARQAAMLGLRRVYWLAPAPEGALIEDSLPVLHRLVEDHQPDAVFVGGTTRGRLIAARLAARLDVTVLTDVKEITQQDRKLTIRHMIFGGGAERIESPLTRPWLATIPAGAFPPAAPSGVEKTEILPQAWPNSESKSIVRERRPRGTTTVNLAAAKKVVCPGRGLVHKEDLGMIEDLAGLLGAEIACTRPLAEGLDWLPRERYIGISGANIKPDLYLGVGVSGQVQHTVGMSESRIVVAINKDKDAPIFSQSDYGIVGDLYAVVPALIEALKSRR